MPVKTNTEADMEALIERRTPDPTLPGGTGCWNWKGPMAGKRPYFLIGGGQIMVRRILWERAKGELPPRHLVNICGNERCVNPDHNPPPLYGREYFTSRTHVLPSGCREWGAGKGMRADQSSGSARVPIIDATGEVVSVAARAFAYSLVHDGVIPKGQVWCACGNDRCLEPTHMRTSLDAPRPSRRAGSDVRRSTLTWPQVEEIRAWTPTGGGEKMTALARRMGISRSAVAAIRTGRTWRRPSGTEAEAEGLPPRKTVGA